MQDQQDHNESVMIALLPITTDWCKIELPHLTLVFAGDKASLDVGAYNEMAKDAATISMMSRPIALEVFKREQFGNWSEDPSDVVDVYRFHPKPELTAMRSVVERWNKSEHKDFNPHVTIGPPGSVVEFEPRIIAFDKIGVFWGRDSEIVFHLKV